MALQANVQQYTTEMEKARRETDALGKDVAELDRKLGQVREGAGIGIAAGTAVGLGVATKAASDLREAQAAANVVFDEGSDVITAYAEDAAQAIGLSKKEALDATVVFGTMFSQIGLGNQESVQLSTSLVTLAADLGSLKNVDPTQIIESMSSAFRGEYDSLQKYIPTLTDAAIKQEALAQTGKTNADSLTMQEKALATYTLMMRDAGPAMGDFARSNGSAATEAKKAAAESKNAAASMGEALLPVAAKLAETVGFVAQQFGRLPGPVQTGVVGIGGMTAATVLLLPKIAEAGVLLARGGSKAIEFARGINLSSSANQVAIGSMASLALGAAVVGMVLADQADMAQRARAQVEQLADAVNKGGQSMAEVVDQYLIDTWAEFGQTFEDQGISFEQYRDLVTGSEADFEAWRQSLPGGSDFLGADEGIAGMRLQLDRTREAVDRYTEAEQKTGDAVDDSTRRRDEATNTLRGHTTAVDEAGAAYDATADRVDKLNDTLADIIQRYRDGINIGTAFAEAIQSTIDVEAANKDLADSRDRLADSERGLRDAYEGVAAANQSVANARESVADAERSLADAYTGVADARRGVTEAEEAAVIARENIVTATQELADAERAATGDSDEYRAAMQGVYDAEVDLAQAQDDSLTAQEKLDQARQDYTRTLAGLRREAEGAADGVIGAELRLRDAQESLATLGDAQRERVNEAQARLAGLDATATTEQRTAAEKALAAAIAALPDADDRVRAELAVRDAQRGVADATERASDAAAEAARVEAAGVEGSDAVVAARQGVIDATTNEVDAQGNLEAAVLRVAGVQVDANGRVTIAQANLEAAIKDRVDADQKVIDARDAVIDAQLRVGDAVRGVRDANREVESALLGVRDANERVTDQKEEIETARGEVAKAERDVAKAVQESIDKYGQLFLVIQFAGPVRTAMRTMTDEARDLVTALGGLNGNFTANVNIGGNAAGAILNGTTDGFEAVMGAVMGSPYAAPTVLVPSDKPGKMGGKGGGVASGKPGSDGLTIGTGPGPWTNPYGPVPAGFTKLGSAPVGSVATTAPASPFQVAGPLAPSWAPPGGGSFDYGKLAEAIRKSNPLPGPLVHIDRVEEGVGLAAVFQQAEFASRAA